MCSHVCMCMPVQACAMHRRLCVEGVLPEVGRGLTDVSEN